MIRDPLSTLLAVFRIETHDLNRSVTWALGLFCAELQANSGDVLIWNAADGMFKPIARVGTSFSIPSEGVQLDANTGRLGLALRTRHPYVANAHDRSALALNEPQDQLIVCGFQTSTSTRGAVLFRTWSRDFSPADKQLIEAFSHWLGLILSISATTAIFTDEPTPKTASNCKLSLREREVASLVARGLTNEEIGVELVITSGTVSNHVEHILRKLEANRRTQIASWAVHNGVA